MGWVALPGTSKERPCFAPNRPRLNNGDYTLMWMAAGSPTTRTAQSFALPRLGRHSRLSSSFIVTTP